MSYVDFGDFAGLISVGRQVDQASQDVTDTHRRVDANMSALVASVVGPEVRGAQAMAGRWDTVGSSLRQVASVAGSVSAAMVRLGSSLQSASSSWTSLVNQVWANGFELSVWSRSVTVTAPAGAKPDAVSQASSLQRELQGVLDSAVSAWNQAERTLSGLHLPDLDDLDDGSGPSAPASGSPCVDEELDRLVPVLLAIHAHVNRLG